MSICEFLENRNNENTILKGVTLFLSILSTSISYLGKFCHNRAANTAFEDFRVSCSLIGMN